MDSIGNMQLYLGSVRVEIYEDSQGEFFFDVVELSEEECGFPSADTAATESDQMETRPEF